MRRTTDRDELRAWLGDALRPGDRIIWSQGAAEPTTVLQELIAVRDRAAGGECFLSIGCTDTPTEEVVDHLRIRGLGALGSHRRLSSAGVLEVVPLHLSQLPAAIRQGVVGVDVALIQVSPPDHEGRHSLGLDAAYAHAAIDTARLVVAEVNAQVPWTSGHDPVPEDRFDLVLETDRALPEWIPRPPTPTERDAARLAVTAVPPRATLQFGIGSAPAAVAGELVGHRDLGLHTGLLDDAQFALVRAGAVAGRAVAGTLAGTRALYVDAAARGVLVRDAERTHGLAALAQVPRFTAVNTAVEIDLTGQVNAESVGERFVGGVGGLVDFVRGAALSEGGRSIFVLASTGSAGGSRIVPRLRGGAVTVARSDVDVVVTEYGVAELRGRSLEERALLLRAIAHPDHRARLTT